MPAYRGTLTEISEQVFTNSTLNQQPSSCAQCDLTLLTCLLIGSCHFCIIPLLFAFYGKPKTQLWRSKYSFCLFLFLFLVGYCSDVELQIFQNLFVITT